MKPRDLLRNATAVARMDRSLEDEYRWLDSGRLLFLRVAQRKPGLLDRTPLAGFTGMIRHFEAYTLDLATGAERALSAFNQRCATDLRAIVCYVRCVDENGKPDRPVERHFRAPRALVSSDGGWLLWDSCGRWTAARLDGSEAVTWPADSAPCQGLWLRDTLKWVAMRERWTGSEYDVPQLVLRRANDPDYRREVAVRGLADGIPAGHTSRNTILLRQDEHG